MLLDTLYDLINEVELSKIETTKTILEFNKRITQEILDASENHILAEYLGIKYSKDTPQEIKT